MFEGLQQALASLLEKLPDANKDGSTAQAILACVNVLQAREKGGCDFVNQQFDTLQALLEDLQNNYGGDTQSDFSRGLAELIDALHARQRGSDLPQLEAAWRSTAQQFERLLCSTAAHVLQAGDKKRLASLLCSWEAADLANQSSVTTNASAAPEEAQSTELSEEKLTHYLRQRFDDASIALTRFLPLAGGFGKETTLFSVSGKTFSGDYVMRRDYGEFPISNDCHQVATEYEVIRRAFEAGFPAADCVWLDTEHPLLPGGDFIVMKKAAGETGGNVFNLQQAVSGDLVDTLADATASLHGLSPLPGLPDLTSCINDAMWQLSTGEAVHKYLSEWFEIFTTSSHTPSAALASIYHWLLDNIHDVAEPPVLLHGDIGFHNMLLDNGKITAVVDWEFCHIGDPAEELGYIRNTTGGALDWQRFMARYAERSGFDISPQRIHYFQIWGHVRNASAANLASTQFADGRSRELKLAFLPFYHVPQFIRAAQMLIDEYD